MTPIQIILIALIVFIVVAIVAFLALNGTGKSSKRNVDLIRGGASSEKRVDEKELQNKRRAEISKKLKANKEEKESDSDKKETLAMRLQQAGTNMSVKKFYVLSVVSCVLFLVLGKLLSVSIFVMILFAIIGFLGFPRFVLRKAIQRRQKKFLKEFADALDAVVRLLKAGMPVAEAVVMISREFDGPVGEEMSIMYDKQKIGVPLHEAAFEATFRMPLPEMQMFAAGLAIQAQTGSSLSEVLINLSGVIRARYKLKRKIMALSSEAIASASIIGCLPPFVACGLWLVNPDYLEPLFTTPTGKMLITGAIGWMCLGILVMKQMINFKI